MDVAILNLGTVVAFFQWPPTSYEYAERSARLKENTHCICEPRSGALPPYLMSEIGRSWSIFAGIVVAADRRIVSNLSPSCEVANVTKAASLLFVPCPRPGRTVVTSNSWSESQLRNANLGVRSYRRGFSGTDGSSYSGRSTTTTLV